MLLPPEITALVDQALPSSWTLPVGVVLAGFGERVYRLLVLAPGLLSGMWVGAQVGALLHLGPVLAAALAAFLAFLGALACARVEAMAVRALGALGGVVAGAALWQMAVHQTAPWWAAVAAGLAGLLGAPYVQTWFMRGITALIGGLCLASFAGRSHDPRIILAVTALGVGFQAWMAGAGGASAAAASNSKKAKPPKR